MAQSTNPALSRAPVSVRKLIQIVSDPAIFGGIAASFALASIGAYLYYSSKRK
jgi:hypothetical protein